MCQVPYYLGICEVEQLLYCLGILKLKQLLYCLGICEAEADTLFFGGFAKLKQLPFT